MALVFTMGLAPCSSPAILTLSFSISSSLLDKIAVQDINYTGLFVVPLREFRGVKILGEPHLPKELLAPAGQPHPVCLKAFSLSGIEISSHTSWGRKKI